MKNFKEGMHEKSEPEDESLLEKTEVTDELKRIDEE